MRPLRDSKLALLSLNRNHFHSGYSAQTRSEEPDSGDTQGRHPVTFSSLRWQLLRQPGSGTWRTNVLCILTSCGAQQLLVLVAEAFKLPRSSRASSGVNSSPRESAQLALEAFGLDLSPPQS